MRTISAAQEKVLASPSRVAHLRVQVKDAGGTWRDLSTLEGKNWVVGAKWSESVDGAVGSATVELVRDVAKLNLAPLDAVSKFNASGSLLGLNREIKIETATLPSMVPPASGDWLLMFHGRIYEIGFAENPLTLQCRDLNCGLQDAFIETERIYGPVKNMTACRTWAPGIEVGPLEAILPTTPNGYCYQNDEDVALLTGSTEPTWPTVAGSFVYDGEATWRCMGPAPDRYGAAPWEPSRTVAVGDLVAVPVYSDGSVLVVYRATSAGTTAATTPDFSTWGFSVTDGTVAWKQRALWGEGSQDSLESMLREILLDNTGDETLVVPVASGWILSTWRQERGQLLDALRNLAAQIGWEVRYRWDSASASFKLTLFSPDRTKTTPDRTFDADDYLSIGSLALSLVDIRNAVDVVYSDSEALSSNGVDYERKTVSVSDSASIAKYGRHWCEIAESSSSNIDTATEATALANAVLSDLKEPNAEQSVTLPYFWPVELGDLYRFAANGKHSSTDLDLAVVGYEHTFSEDGVPQTVLTCRGKPSTGATRWHRRLARGTRDRASTLRPDAPTGITVANAAGRSVVTFAPYRNSDLRAETELYVSTVSGFIPSSATLNQRGMTNAFTVFRAAGTYYGRLITRDRLGNESAPSAQFTLAPT